MKKIKDMNGIEIKIGDKIKKHSLIKDPTSSFKEATVKFLDPMHSGGDNMVWAGGGGAHHPMACAVIKE